MWLGVVCEAGPWGVVVAPAGGVVVEAEAAVDGGGIIFCTVH